MVGGEQSFTTSVALTTEKTNATDSVLTDTQTVSAGAFRAGPEQPIPAKYKMGQEFSLCIRA